MKRLSVFIFLPLILSALERVNLIRNRSFEREDSVWIVESGSWREPNPAVGTTKDSSESATGLFSASADTREAPAWKEINVGDSVAIRQSFLIPKILSDLDSLSWQHLIVLGTGAFYSTHMCIVGFTYANPERNGFGYGFINPAGSGVDNWVDIPEKISEDDLVWRSFEKSLQKDFVESSLVPSNRELASFVLIDWGVWFGVSLWRGQKVYWDDIRLMGYVDYDVGVREILSGDSVWTDTPYTPVARIKNFGREDAPEFSVIAEIWEGETRVYYDSLPWSLTSDTEDTVSFKDFTPSNAANHTLIVRTVMKPDESDEDDEMSKTLFGTGISEQPEAQSLTLEAESFTAKPKISYSLPAGQSGTISIFDASGRRIERMTVQGSGRVEFDSALPSGVYIVKLDAETKSITKKAVVLK
jgi:hypothetical protein